jgi:hypothetical protein
VSILHTNQIEEAARNRAETAELRELLHQVLSNQQDLQQVRELQEAGDEHVAPRIMEAGQIVII